MTSTAQLQLRINELMSELSDVQVRVGGCNIHAGRDTSRSAYAERLHA